MAFLAPDMPASLILRSFLVKKFATFLRSRAKQEVIPFIVIINGGCGDPNGKGEEDMFLFSVTWKTLRVFAWTR